MNSHINDSSKPLIFIGSNSNLEKYIEVCDDHNIKIHGLIDADYFGNTESLAGIPIIDSEIIFNNLDKLNYYRDNFNFFCATNWLPTNNPISIRNKEKRSRLITLIKQYNLNCITLTEKQSKVSKFATIGRGVYLDYLVLISPNVTIGDFTCIYNGTSIGHHTVIGENCVLQGNCIILSECVVDNNVYFGTSVQALKSKIQIREGTFIHEMVYLRRDTQPNEIITIYSNKARQLLS
jgi:acetyltransferase-like isoleucine patch superfamily enzyme